MTIGSLPKAGASGISHLDRVHQQDLSVAKQRTNLLPKTEAHASQPQTLSGARLFHSLLRMAPAISRMPAAPFNAGKAMVQLATGNGGATASAAKAAQQYHENVNTLASIASVLPGIGKVVTAAATAASPLLGAAADHLEAQVQHSQVAGSLPPTSEASPTGPCAIEGVRLDLA